MTVTASGRTVALPELPKTTAVRRLKASLESRGLHDHAAASIAVAVCDPTAARQQLAAPGRLRVDGGYLEVITIDVWTPSVMAYPTNPRVLPAFSYQIESNAERRRPLPPLLASSDPDAVELLVPGVPAAELVGALDAQVNYLRRTNDLRDTVGEQGIREPLLLLPLVIDLDWPVPRHRNRLAKAKEIDTVDAPALLAAIDGSSRVTAAHFHLGIEPADSLLKYLSNSRMLRHKISNIIGLAQASELSEEESAQCQSLVAPASIVVGFVPDDPESDSLIGAINSRLGALHVDPPRPWSTSSRLDVQLDAAIDALAGAGLDVGEADWLAGRLSPEEAVEAGFRSAPDIRAARLLWQIGQKDSASARALRRLTARSRITANLRAEIAAEGAIRGFRSQLTDTQIQAARSLLSAIYMMDEVQTFSWEIRATTLGRPTSADKTWKEACEELQVYGRPGPIVQRLLVQAGYWLARMRVVPRQTRGGQKDRRDITTVLSQMSHTERGVRQFIQIIEDGRDDIFPRQVRATGRMQATDSPLTDEWLRQTWSARSAKAPHSLPLSPEAQLSAAAQTARAAVADLVSSLDALREPEAPDGSPLVDGLGLEPELANQMIKDLLTVQMRLSVYAHRGEASEGRSYA